MSCESGVASLVDQASAAHRHRPCAAALVRWDRLLVLGLLVMLGGLLVPPTPLSGASGTSATVHEVGALRVHLVLLAGRTISAGASTSGYVVIDNAAKAPIAVTHSPVWSAEGFGDTYQSRWRGVPYNHADPTERYGISFARFRKCA